LLSQQRLQEGYQVATNAVKGGSGIVAGMVKAKVEQAHHQVRLAQREDGGDSQVSEAFSQSLSSQPSQ
jgi:hypothetical protein